MIVLQTHNKRLRADHPSESEVFDMVLKLQVPNEGTINELHIEKLEEEIFLARSNRQPCSVEVKGSLGFVRTRWHLAMLATLIVCLRNLKGSTELGRASGFSI